MNPDFLNLPANETHSSVPELHWHPMSSVIQMPGFRSLGDEEIVEFECRSSDKGLEATAVMGPEGENCKGSHRRPMSKKRFRKIRYVNQLIPST
ncbi:protein lin-28 homolog [Caerostris darwini]|uniref:Protein lin-28 homolog n=1 Tax=Caerostris darwini TaxID=1538125 RepID=A0AAV4RLM0_9ARAC|nr:protein lin-28 homolog [Caerostris darwini]